MNVNCIRCLSDRQKGNISRYMIESQAYTALSFVIDQIKLQIHSWYKYWLGTNFNYCFSYCGKRRRGGSNNSTNAISSFHYDQWTKFEWEISFFHHFNRRLEYLIVNFLHPLENKIVLIIFNRTIFHYIFTYVEASKVKILHFQSSINSRNETKTSKDQRVNEMEPYLLNE